MHVARWLGAALSLVVAAPASAQAEKAKPKIELDDLSLDSGQPAVKPPPKPAAKAAAKDAKPADPLDSLGLPPVAPAKGDAKAAEKAPAKPPAAPAKAAAKGDLLDDLGLPPAKAAPKAPSADKAKPPPPPPAPALAAPASAPADKAKAAAPPPADKAKLAPGAPPPPAAPAAVDKSKPAGPNAPAGAPAKAGAAPALALPTNPMDLPLPDLLRPDVKPTYQLGIYKLVHPGQPDEPLFDEIEKSFVSVSEIAPAIRSTVLMKSPPKACDLEDDGCFALLGGFQQLSQILVGSLTKAENGLAVRVRVIDVQTQRRISQAEQLVASQDQTEIKAWAEALACKLLIPNGCQGEVMVDLDLPEMQLVVDQAPLKRAGDGKAPERLRLPVGVRRMRVTIGQRTSLERPLPVLRKATPGVALYARQFEQGGLSLLAPKDLPLDKDGNRKVPPSVRPKVAEGKWTKPVGYVVAGLGVVAAGVGGLQGMQSKSLVDEANAAYDKNGGAFLQGDLTKISDAKTKASTANILFITGAVLVTVGLTMAFAF